MSAAEITGDEKTELVAKQWREAKGPSPMVTCGCGLCAPIRFLFRCLYCGQFFCQRCGEAHFGMTRVEYNAQRNKEVECPSTSIKLGTSTDA